MRMQFRKRKAQHTGVLLLAVLSCALIIRFGRADGPVIRIGDWPLAPPSDHPEFLTIESAIPKPPPLSPLADMSGKSSIKGVIAYAPEIRLPDEMVLPNEPARKRFIAFHGVGVTGTVGEKDAQDASYPVKPMDGQVYDPQFSPNGQYLLLKLGEPTPSFMSYKLFLWDIKGQKLERVNSPDNLAWPQVAWSPDEKYLAFVAGGDRGGSVDRDIDRLKLCVYSLRTHKNHFVLMNPAVTSFAWTPQNTLLFTMQPGDDPKNELLNNKMYVVPNKRMDIYEVLAEKGPLVKVLSQGSMPTPSPDGKWIAYLDQTDTPVKPEGTNSDYDENSEPILTIPHRVFLYNRAENKRVLIRKTGRGSLLWTPDSQNLIGVQELPENNERISERTFQTEMLDIKKLVSPQWKIVAKIRANSLEPQISKDGRFLFLKASTYGKSRGQYEAENNILIAVDLQSGAVTDIAHLENFNNRAVGYAWREIEQPITSIEATGNRDAGLLP